MQPLMLRVNSRLQKPRPSRFRLVMMTLTLVQYVRTTVERRQGSQQVAVYRNSPLRSIIILTLFCIRLLTIYCIDEAGASVFVCDP
ncbi:hypothetical protein GGR57DRAFT_260369 [Xylariaceae sp. FL1272]|nr:hypothetical protein GGR57DRAFT_260369 [Xylariaceae sp. FL1272]